MKKHPLILRAEAAQACMDRFNGLPGVPGKRDCSTLAAHAMRRMGHKATLLTESKHKSWASAIKYIRSKGCADLLELMDATGLPRIAPAMALPADIIGMPSEPGDGFGCSLTVCLGNNRILGINGTTGKFEPMIPNDFVTAWRL